MCEMPCLSQEQFDAQIQAEEQSVREQSRKANARSPVRSKLEGKNEPDKRKSPSECLFCNVDSLNVRDNVEHMHSVHGLYVPEPARLSDMETFLGYLAFIVYDCNECLYCGAERNSLEAIRSHMKDKGHCMINLDRESELLDFWDVSDDGDCEDANAAWTGTTGYMRDHISATELRLPSGFIVASRLDTAPRARPTLARSRTKASQTQIEMTEMNVVTDGSDNDSPKALVPIVGWLFVGSWD